MPYLLPRETRPIMTMGESKPSLCAKARIGLVGEFLARFEPQSESDPAGMLIDFLATFGNAVGRGPRMHVQADVHRAVVNVVTVGATSRGRKGTGRAFVRRVFAEADPSWSENCVVSGHASGEGLISDLADEQRGDPRLFVEEVEFSSTLRVAGRDGSILSEVIRKVWDGLPVSNRRAQSQVTVKKHHVSIVGNITNEELNATLRRTEGFNGFANRFLWVSTERSQRLPFGGDLTDRDFTDIGRSITSALDKARRIEIMRRTKAGDAVWVPWYNAVPDDVPGLWGSATARAEAYVLRLSIIYALMDGTAQIDQRHIEAAIAVWDYCSESARLIFGDRTGHSDVDKLIDALEAVGRQGLNRTEQTRLFRNAKRKAGQARETATQLGLVVEIKQPTATRPQQVLYVNQHAPEIGGD
jgi:hypothetical protein